MARTRSPSYPGIDLKEAIEKARTIYSQESQSAALIGTIATHWGYKPTSGSTHVAVAALRKYDLVEYVGMGSGRKAKLTDSALRIIRDDRTHSPERDKVVRRAALLPKIHQELWARKKEGASSETLVSFLKLERAFADSAAPDLVERFLRTVAYANLAEADSISDNDTDMLLDEDLDLADDQSDGAGTQTLPRKPRTYRLPLSSQTEAVLQVPGTMTESAWTQMMAILTAMKPGILSPDDDEG